jgi:hypothetical protein
MEDFIIVHYSHTYLPWRKEVVEACRQFVATGEFPRKASREAQQAAATNPQKTYRTYASPKMQSLMR